VPSVNEEIGFAPNNISASEQTDSAESPAAIPYLQM
jgi:hypothetical protein